MPRGEGSAMSKLLTIAVSTIGFTLIICGQGNFSSRALANGPEIGPGSGSTGNSYVPEHGPVGEAAPKAARALVPVPTFGPEIRTEKRTVLVPQVVTENRKVTTTVLRKEQRERELTVLKHVPETIERTRTSTVLEPQVRSHQETFTILKPVTNCVEETYTVE